MRNAMVRNDLAGLIGGIESANSNPQLTKAMVLAGFDPATCYRFAVTRALERLAAQNLQETWERHRDSVVPYPMMLGLGEWAFRDGLRPDELCLYTRHSRERVAHEIDRSRRVVSIAYGSHPRGDRRFHVYMLDYRLPGGDASRNAHRPDISSNAERDPVQVPLAEIIGSAINDARTHLTPRAFREMLNVGRAIAADAVEVGTMMLARLPNYRNERPLRARIQILRRDVVSRLADSNEVDRMVATLHDHHQGILHQLELQFEVVNHERILILYQSTED